MSILDQLNPQQREAATTIEGPVLIFAGAGTGKTRVLTHRIAYMVQEKQILPEQILAVTFTNKAADEMKERISQLIGARASQVLADTFHSVCARLLRRYGEHIGISPNFAIYEGYQEGQRANNALDFDDLLFKTVELLESKPAVREELQARFPYILVDEYQDINYAQYRFIRLLAGTRGNVCVVGDDDQSIYSWRGADVRLILSFQKDFENTRVIKLEQNYRSTRKILECAHHVICQNETRAEKKLWTENGVGENLVLHQAVDEDKEAEWVAATIVRQVQKSGMRYGDYAILYRINAISRAFEIALRGRGVPYQMVGEMSFYDRAEVINLVAYLKLIFNPSDAASLRRIINTPVRGLGSNMLNCLTQVASEAGVTLYEALPLLADDSRLRQAQRHAALNFYDMVEGLRKDAEQMGVAELVSRVLDRSGYLKALRNSKRAEGAERADSLNEFIAGAVKYQQNAQEPTLGGFLKRLAPLADTDKPRGLDNSVSLMTLHAAKGLEFPVVFMAGMEEGICPHKRSIHDEFELAEERRLCYVGLTRAKHMVHLSHARKRTIFHKVRERQPSRFLTDLPQELVDHSGVSAYASRVRVRRNTTSRAATYADVRETAGGSAPSKAPRTQKKAPRVPGTPVLDRQAAEIFHPGTKIVHDDWGNGVVVSISQDGTLYMLTIRFEKRKHGVKKMLAGHPKLKAR
ncbi:MAG: UvrD-helicase domain-containing protein [candidate division WS1 bacterium]|jgi:DNA helicase-2/ATP-dependent DNA helicase PcrA|nr:UvrD-helicase domain-containing protein [candidate division WS1 bacterium]